MPLQSEDLISRLANSRDSLSKAEGRIAQLVLDDPEFATQASTTELATRADTSTPTVTRFCRSMGYEGLREFKLALAKAHVLSLRYLKSESEPKSVSELADLIVDGASRALETARQQMHVASIQALAERLLSCRRVLIFGGGGGSGIVADDAVNRLFRLGVHAIACHDGQLQRMMAATLNEEDVLLVISTSGRYQELIDCVDIAREYQGFTAAITRPGSPLAQQVDLLLPVSILENPNIFLPTESRYALLAIIDVLAAETAFQAGESAVELMRRMKHHLAAHRNDDSNDPLGD